MRIADFNSGSNCIFLLFLCTMVVLLNHKVFALQPLPIESVIPQLIEGIAGYPQLILQAAPGAGKSTYFPLALLRRQVIKGKIIMLEPRRLAAKSIATYIASQLGQAVGQQVGYRIKGESQVSQTTQLEVVTEGILTRMIQTDPELTGIGMIIFDEFHERSLHADLALALSLEVQAALRDDLTLVVMSATLDDQALQGLLPQALLIKCDGRQYPIDIRYAPLKPNEDMVSKMAHQIQSLITNERGSILAFLPGVASIKQLETRLNQAFADDGDILIAPLYGQLSFAAQQQALHEAPLGKRKIVLATNVAETSLTIAGIRMVVDSGLARQARFDPINGVTRLEQCRIAQSSAQQRAGRAGRLEAGICVRLYSEAQFKQQPKVPAPDILHSDLTATAFELAHWGMRELNELSWLDTPPTALIDSARQLLISLGVMDQRYQLTRQGQQAYRLGIEPRLAAMILQASALGDHGQVSAIACAALVEEPDSHAIDLTMALHLWQQGQHSKSSRLALRARQLAKQLNIPFDLAKVDETCLRLAAALAYPDRIAQRRGSSTDAEFKLANGHGVRLHQAHFFAQANYLVVCDLMRHQGADSQIQLACELSLPELLGPLSHLTTRNAYLDWDDKRGRLVAEDRILCGQLVLKSQVTAAPDKEKMTQALLNYVRRKGLVVLNFNSATLEWLERARCARDWLPDEAWPALDEQGLLSNLELWLEPYMTNVQSVKQLTQLPHQAALNAYLGWPLTQQLDQWLPTHWTLPTGTRKAIRYRVGAPATLSVRIQEVFGEQASPVIAQGTQRLVLELLSPAQRPIQVTQDLAAFWSGSYKDVQKEMKGRYPKHVWPDDPANHIATTKTKRHFHQG
jgi:ATP-dependent helicase HrpB